MNLNSLINFVDYSQLDIALIMAGTIFWIITYAIILRNAIKKKFVEMPAPAAAANLAWEFIWAFFIVTNLGILFQWGLRVWFIMDVFIFYFIIKYGVKQFNSPVLKKNFLWSVIAQVLVWIPAFYYFYKEGYDTMMGTTSAYLITVLMAILFIVNLINAKNKTYFSKEVAISKFLGNSFMMTFVFVHHDGMIFLKIMTVVVLFLNALYIIMVFKNKNKKHV